MSSKLWIYTLCLLVNTPALLSSRHGRWLSIPQMPSSSESFEIALSMSSKLADRANTMTEKIDEQDTDKLLSLFSNTNKESSEAFLSEMLRVLQNIIAKKPQMDSKQIAKQNNAQQNIAWSYYDDVGK